jgi:tetratricopeptide (TPR) repeat protein
MDEKRRQLDSALVQDMSLLSAEDGLQLLGLIIDYSTELADGAALEQALAIANEVQRKLSDARQAAELHFFLGNVWDELRKLRRAADETGWTWDLPELVKANRAFRTAYSSEGFSSLHRYRKCQILTNIGNHLDHLGRFVEAIEYWDHALTIDPDFAMAIGNRGMGLWTYARHLYDPRHATVFVRMARAALTRAVERPLEGNAGDFFRRLLSRVDQVLAGREPDREVHFREFSLGQTKAEGVYRRVCLMRRLFLKPLNDL